MPADDYRRGYLEGSSTGISSILQFNERAATSSSTGVDVRRRCAFEQGLPVDLMRMRLAGRL